MRLTKNVFFKYISLLSFNVLNASRTTYVSSPYNFADTCGFRIAFHVLAFLVQIAFHSVAEVLCRNKESHGPRSFSKPSVVWTWCARWALDMNYSLSSPYRQRETVCTQFVCTWWESRTSSTIRSAKNSSKLCTHFRLVHNEVYAIIEPIIRGRDKNKRTKPAQSTTLTDELARSRQKAFENALLCILHHQTYRIACSKIHVFIASYSLCRSYDKGSKQSSVEQVKRYSEANTKRIVRVSRPNLLRIVLRWVLSDSTKNQLECFGSRRRSKESTCDLHDFLDYWLWWLRQLFHINVNSHNWNDAPVLYVTESK